MEQHTTSNPATPILPETTTPNILIEEEALRIKSRISNMWNTNLNTRRSTYWQAYRNQKIAEKYDEWSTLENIFIPQWLQMKAIPNEPEALTKRREKQVFDNLKVEIELLNLRKENQEEKYRNIDQKMKEEIQKIATGERQNMLLKLWNEDCTQNEDISHSRWEKRNAAWLAKYEVDFKTKYEDKNPYIKIGDDLDAPISYAEAASINLSGPQTTATGSKAPQRRQNTRSRGSVLPQNALPQRSPRQGPRQQNPQLTVTGPDDEQRLTTQAPRPSIPPLVQQRPRENTTRVENDQSEQVYFLCRGRGRGRGQGRGRGRGRGQNRGRSRGRPPDHQ